MVHGARRGWGPSQGIFPNNAFGYSLQYLTLVFALTFVNLLGLKTFFLPYTSFVSPLLPAGMQSWGQQGWTVFSGAGLLKVWATDWVRDTVHDKVSTEIGIKC